MSKIKKMTLGLSLILFAVLIVLIYLFAFSYKKNPRIKGNMMDFKTTYDEAEKDGFYEVNSEMNKNRLITSNKTLELYLDQTTSHFKIKDKISGEFIESNPDIDDPSGVKGDILDKQKATIVYRYFSFDGRNSSEYNNFTKSISHPEESRMPSDSYSTFKIKELENGFQVYYRIRDYTVDFLDFPKYIDPVAYEKILKDESGQYDQAKRHLVAVYRDVINPISGMYEANNYEQLSNIFLDRLYKIFYEDKLFGEYTRERVKEENQLNGYFEDPNKTRFSFDVAIQVLLEENGIEIKLINESLKEYSNSKLSTIALYPYFGTAINVNPETGEDTKGQLIVPDGSGAIINFNNGKTSSQSYRKRLYGQDMANMPFEMPEENQRILFPVYGMIKEKIGYAAIITEGDAMTTLNADISGRSRDSYNKIYPTFHLRESESVIIGPAWESKVVSIWTREKVQTDFTYKLTILNGEDNTYFGIANAYKEYLIKEKGLTILTEKNSKVLLELLGTFDSEKHFVGVPYNAMGTLTNYSQALEIIKELNDLGVNDIDIIFKGISNGGLSNKIEDKVKFESKVGSKKEFRKFEKDINDLNINVYPTANFFSTYGYKKGIDEFKYSSRRLSGDSSKWFEYHEPTRLPYQETQYDYRDPANIISPLYYETLYGKYNKSFEFNNLNLDNIGSKLTSDYNKKLEVYKQESLLIQERLLKNMKQENIIISEPLGFSVPYIDVATDLPFESTLYELFDYQIPLIQLMLNDILPYTISSMNLPSNRGIEYLFMKVLETGSDLKYTLSYNSSIELLNTYHDNYMSTLYTNWTDLIKDQNNILVNNGLNTNHLINHEVIETNVYKVVYSNNVEIYLNYSLATKVVDGVEIKGMNYYIKGGK